MYLKQGVHTNKLVELAVLLIILLALLGLMCIGTANAQTTNLTVQIVSWDRIGIDHNNPSVGPNVTAIQAKICNNGSSTATNVTVNFTWNSGTNSQYIYLVQNEQAVKNLGTLEPGNCTDVFFLVGMQRNSTTEGKTRTYTLNVTSNQSNPETANQTLTVEGLIGSSSQYSTLVNVSDYSPSECTNFQVSVWDNVTQANPGNQIGFPVTYDPGVVELVNVTVQSYTSKFIYVGTYYSLLSAITGKSYHYITYTFHALSCGDSDIAFIIQIGSPYKYNNDYGKVNVSVDVTLNLGDYVWEDLNGNGIQEAGEPGIANVTVNLSYYNNTYIGTTTTNATGYYLFSDLHAGNYTLQFVAPPNYSFTQQNVGADDKDSDANATGWTTAPIWLLSEHNYTWDAGLYRYASIGDYVWNDQNGNGIQDPGINALAGVNVTLYNSTMVEIANTTTNGSGKYLFTNLTPGDYYVEFVPLTGFNFSPKDNGPDDRDSDANTTTGRTDLITLTSGEVNETIDAGLFQGTTLGDFVWHDLNGNGIQDVEEPGIDNVTVKLYNASFEHINTTNTSEGGYYGFGPLLPMTTYYVEFVLPTGYVFTSQYQSDYTNDSDANETGWTGAIITPASGRVNNTIDAGLNRLASLGGYGWRDLNANGVQDPGPYPFGGVNVTLYNSTMVEIANTTTNTTVGFNYLFTNLRPGGYYVKFEKPEGWNFSPKDNDPNDTIDSDANETGWTDLIPLASGEHNDTTDAGLHQGTGLAKFVWHDLNANGIQDDGEPGIDNVTVYLYNASFELINTTTTKWGYYGFGNLSPNTAYYIQFVLPADYDFFSPQYQGDYTNDSNANATGWTEAITTPGPGLVNDTIDAGMYRAASLGDFVWEDLNANGIQEGGELGIDNVTVKLYNASFYLINTTNTSEGGNYSFGNLTPNTTYYLEFVLPTGYVFSPRYQSNYTNDSDANETGWTGAIITPMSGLVDTSIDAGLYLGASIGDFVWRDCSDDGIQQGDEPGVGNVTVELYSSIEGYVNTTKTNETGYYSFGNLKPGNYSLWFELPTGYVGWTLEDQGSDNSKDSDVDFYGWTDLITLGYGVTNLSWDAGLNTFADLNVTKEAEDRTYYPGDNITYNVTVCNSGNVTVTNVTVNDTLFGVVVNLGTLLPGTCNWTVYNHTVNDTDACRGWLNNSVNVSAVDICNVTIYAEDAWWNVTEIGYNASINVTKEAEAGPYYPGDNITYNITVCNSGNVTVTNVTVNDTLFGVVVNLGTLLPGTCNWTVYNHTVNDTDACRGWLNNSVNVSAVDICNVTIYAEDAWWNVTEIGYNASINVTKEAEAGPYYPGDNITYNITVCNSGNVTISYVTINDSLLGSFNTTNLSKGDCRILNKTYNVTPADCATGWINNTAQVNGTDYCGKNVTGASAFWNVTVECGYCISGYKLNASSDLGLANWMINVTKSSGVVVDSNVTDATGYWQVCGLAPGNYTVCEELQKGWRIIEPELGCQNVSLGTANITGLNFTNSECNGSISDFVWLDTNQNGIQDVNESGIAGVRVNLYLHESPETLYGWTYTNGTGIYSFDKLCEGNYSLQFIPPPGYAFTIQIPGNNTHDSNADSSGRTDVFYLGSGEVNTTIDAGLYYLPEQVPAFTHTGLIALLSSLSAVAVLSIKVRKRG